MEFWKSTLGAAFVSGIFTLFTGAIAICIYIKQKWDEKTNAALTVLIEIRNAESKITLISASLQSGNNHDLPSVLPTNSWRKYSHLFATNFDEDELTLLNSFYTSCESIEDLVRKQNDFVWIATEERAREAQRLLGSVHLEFQRDMATGGPESFAKNQEKFNLERSALTKYYTDEEYFYAPLKTIRGLRFHIDGTHPVTTTTCGQKLKRLARRRL